MSCLKGLPSALRPGFFHSVVFSLDLAARPPPTNSLRVGRYLCSPCRVQIAFSSPPPLALLTRGGFPARPCRCTFGRELNCSFARCRQHLSVRITLTFKLLLAL